MRTRAIGFICIVTLMFASLIGVAAQQQGSSPASPAVKAPPITVMPPIDEESAKKLDELAPIVQAKLKTAQAAIADYQSELVLWRKAQGHALDLAGLDPGQYSVTVNAAGKSQFMQNTPSQ